LNTECCRDPMNFRAHYATVLYRYLSFAYLPNLHRRRRERSRVPRPGACWGPATPRRGRATGWSSASSPPSRCRHQPARCWSRDQPDIHTHMECPKLADSVLAVLELWLTRFARIRNPYLRILSQPRFPYIIQLGLS
jgi:hypothetical protein